MGVLFGAEGEPDVDFSEGFEQAGDAFAWAEAKQWNLEMGGFAHLGSDHARNAGGSGFGIVATSGDTPRVAVYKTKLNLLGPQVDVTWHVRVNRDGMFDLFTRGMTEVPNEMETLTQIRLENGMISACFNGRGGFTPIGPYAVGEWIKVTARIDFDSQCYRVFINDDSSFSEMHFATDATGRMTSVDWLGFAKYKAGEGNASLVDIVVETPAPSGGASVVPSLAAPFRLPIGEGGWEGMAVGAGANVADRVDGLGAISAGGGEGRSGDNASVGTRSGEVNFLLPGTSPEKRFRNWKWSIPESARPQGVASYARVQFKAEGFHREIKEAYPVLKLVGRTGKGKLIDELLLDSSHVVNDGQAHSVIVKLKKPLLPEAVNVQLVTCDARSSLALLSLELYGEMPKLGLLQQNLSPLRPGTMRDLIGVNLDALFNDSVGRVFARSLEKNGRVLDGEPVIAGVPFQWAKSAGNGEGMNVVMPPETPSGNDEMIPFLRGGRVARLAYGPNGRDDSFEVPIGRAASEIFLYLVSENIAVQQRALSGGAPYQFDDIEAFSIEMVYEDGASDLAFPFSLEDREPVVRRMAGSYVIRPSSPDRVVKSLILHNRVYGNTVGLAAVTLNPSTKYLLPELAAEPPLFRPPERTPVVNVPASVRSEGARVIAENSFYRLVVDTSRGLSIESWNADFASDDGIKMDPRSGVELVLEGRTYHGRDFSFERMDSDGKTVGTVFFKSREPELPVSLQLRMEADETNELKLSLSVHNSAKEEIKPTVRFPYIRNLQIGALADTWYLFPQYRNVLSNQDGFYRARNDREFPMQFLDLYNPRIGCGLGVLTRNRGFSPMIYSLEKAGAGVSTYVEYPGNSYRLAAGERRTLPETVLLSHSGDWHVAFSAYRKWLASWRSHDHPAAREWTDRLFLMYSLMPSSVLSNLYNHTPTFVDPVTREYDIAGVLRAQKEVFEIMPDAIDFYNWFYCDAKKSFSYGASLEDAYTNAGGLLMLRKALKDLNQENISTGLYMIPDRVGPSVKYVKDHGHEGALRNAAGDLLINSDELYMCPASERWAKYFRGMCTQLQADTGINFIYIDVFSFTSEMACVDPDHGHPVPLETNRATHDLLKDLREALPAKTGLYGEYPVNDVSNGMIDGNISYYFLPLERYLTPYSNVKEEAGRLLKGVTHLYRFAFPSVKQLNFAFGMEGDTWGHMKATFFNGDAIFDATWRLYYPRNRQFLKKALLIKREYIDCFTTRHGEPMVQTERTGVFANRFPGTNRVLWTLYNERPSTVHGPVIVVEHREGATYFDVWNQKEVEFEVKDGKALINLKLDPQGVGCIVQTFAGER